MWQHSRVNSATATNGSLATQVGRAIRWRLPLVLLVALPMSAAGLWELSRQPDVYQAVAVLSVAPRAEEAASSDLVRLSAQRYAVGVGSAATMQAVAERVELTESDLRSSVDISVPTETANIRIEVSMESAVLAEQVANLVAAAGQSAATQDPLVVVDLASAAAVPEQPTSPQRDLITALILLVAIGSGVLAALILERLRPRARSEADIKTMASAPVLGVLPRSPLAAGSLTGALDDARVGPEIRSLRTRLLAMRSEAASMSFAITGIEPGSTRTTVSTLLSLALARGGIRTALVYTEDTPATRLYVELLELHPDAVQSTMVRYAPASMTRTHLLSGRLLVLSPAPGEAESDRLAGVLPKLIVEAAQFADLVLVDAPPIVDDVAGSAVITQVDAALLVVARGSLAKACRLASTHLADLGVPLLGTVIDEGRRSRWRLSRSAAVEELP